jgi:hypothetical protein
MIIIVVVLLIIVNVVMSITTEGWGAIVEYVQVVEKDIMMDGVIV